MGKNYQRYESISTEQYDDKKSIVSLFMSRAANKKIKDMVISWKNKKILELGCGTGRFTKYYYQNNTVICVDLNTHLFPIKEVPIRQGDVTRLNEVLRADESFYYIVAFWLTEYLSPADILSMLNHCKMHLQEDGRIIMTFITRGLWGRIYILGAAFNGINKYNYRIKELRPMFQEAGFKLIRCQTIKSMGFEFGILVELG